jgi:hypothetical protein
MAAQLAAVPEHAPLVLLRRREASARIKAVFYINSTLMSLPDDEAIIHAFFPMGRMARPVDKSPKRISF